jgi:hypothetical protein
MLAGCGMETRHLFVLAGLTPPEATQVTACEGISPGTRRMLDSLINAVAIFFRKGGEIDTHQAAEAVVPGHNIKVRFCSCSPG